MTRKKQDFGKKKEVERKVDGNNEALNTNQQIPIDVVQMVDMDGQDELGQALDEIEDPFVNIMGGPRRFLIEEMEELSKASSSNSAIQQQNMDENFQCTSGKMTEIDSRKRKQLTEIEDIGSSKKVRAIIIDSSESEEMLSLHDTGLQETESIDINESLSENDNEYMIFYKGKSISSNEYLIEQRKKNKSIQEQNKERKRKQRQNQTDREKIKENEQANQRMTKSRKKMPKYLHGMYPHKAEFYKLSDFKYQCSNCKAVHWIEEFNKKKGKNGYLGCCNYGNLSNLDQTIDDYPAAFRVLYNSTDDMHKSYIENIRKVNSSFSFASLSCFKFTFPTPGPPVYRIQGQVYHKFNKVVQPQENESPTNGQLYFLDPSEIYEQRMDIFDKCENLMAYIEVSLREHNLFAESYKMMKEICDEEEEKAKNEGKDMPDVKLLFSLKEGFDKNRYNLPVSNDVYAIIVCNAEDEIIPANYVVNLKGKKELINLHPMDPIVEPMTYPLFYPLGTRGWNHKLLDKRHKKISLCDYVKYRLYYREESSTGKFFPHHHSKKLFQQWCVDQYTRIEWERLMYFGTDTFQRTFAKN